MEKRTYSEKLTAVLSYCFIIGFINCFSKKQNKYLKKHSKKGKVLNLITLGWLLFVILSYRIVYILPFENNIITLIKLILYIIYCLVLLLLLVYQIYSIIKILKKD
ncbi:MAG: hypothetical protein IJO63_04680 [Bacilli bacterium]|nr:hypothetical protein [Bacilli bacterium]